MTQDHTLLHQYTSQGSRQALDELIRKHLDLVYSSALRQVRNSHLAEDITQAVFLILAQRARKIRDGVAVAGWLLAVTRTTAVDAMRKRTLDRRHEETLAKPELAPAESAPWDQIAPVLDSALSRLPQHERDAVVLRVLENQSLAEVGAELRITEGAAKMRVSRALARLKTLLGRHGITTGAAAITTIIGARAVHAAPGHLLTATLSGTASPSIAALVQRTLRAMAWDTAKLAAAVALVFLLPFAAGAILLSYAPNPSPPVDPLAAIPVANAAVESAAKIEVLPAANDVVDPAAFGAVDLVADTTGPRDGQQFTGLVTNPRLNVSSSVKSLTSDASGNIYAGGMSRDLDGLTRGIVRQKAAGHSEWTTILDVRQGVQCVSTDPAGDVYAGAAPWSIFKRSAGQTDFVAATTDKPASLGRGRIEGLTADADGNVYACGAIEGHWIVQKQTLGAGNFITVDYFVLDQTAPLETPVFRSDSRESSQAISVAVVPGSGPSAGIYVVGMGDKFNGTDSGGSPTYIRRWLVRKSTDGGTTWSTVDDVIGGANAICPDAAGNIYVAGHMKTAQNEDNWVLRKSATGSSNSWSVIDIFVPAPDQIAIPCTVGVDRAGNVYVVGRTRDLTTEPTFHGIVRSNASGKWQTVDDYQPQSGPAGLKRTTLFPNPNYVPALGAGLWGFATDSDGRIYVGGWIQGQTSGWIIRSVDPAQLTPIAKSSPPVRTTSPSIPMTSPTVSTNTNRGLP